MLEFQCLAPGQFAVAITELLGAVAEIILLFAERGLKLLKLSLPVRESLLALADRLVVRGGGFALLALKCGAVILDPHPFPLDGVPFRRQLPVFELLFEFPLPFRGGVVFLLELGDFFRGVGRLFVAARRREQDQRGNGNQVWVLHGFQECGLFRRDGAMNIQKNLHGNPAGTRRRAIVVGDFSPLFVGGRTD